jgi:hypothetical protein
MVFILLKSVPSIPTFFRAFIKKQCCILLNVYSSCIETIMWILSLIPFIYCIIYNTRHTLNQLYIPEMKLT